MTGKHDRPWPLPELLRRRYKSRLRSRALQEEARESARGRGDEAAAAEAEALRDGQTGALAEIFLIARAQGCPLEVHGLMEEVRREDAAMDAACAALREADRPQETATHAGETP